MMEPWFSFELKLTFVICYLSFVICYFFFFLEKIKTQHPLSLIFDWPRQIWHNIPVGAKGRVVYN